MMMAMERNRELERWKIVEGLSQQFIRRWDIHARQLEDGRYICVTQPFKMSLMYLHLRGDITLGIYLLDSKSQAKFVVLDADKDVTFGKLKDMAVDLNRQGIPSYQETSRRAGHLWMFFKGPVPGDKAKGFGKGLLEAYGVEAEVYPKQERLSQGPGSLIRMPFGIHRKSGERYPFIGLGNFRRQMEILSNPQTVSTEAVEMYQYRKEIHHYEGHSERFTDVPLVEFIGQYVDLRPIASGALGLCPFHEDRQPSFGVNSKGNYWHCFAGCGGGDIVSFWMKWKNCDYKTAIKELGEVMNGRHDG
jgi:TOTE conflict system, Archaeo-Eukaryotic Primase domain/CHC2 zinc finger